MSTIRVQIKEIHLDTFGHVNNAAYLTLLEDARWDLVTKNGFGLEIVQEKQIGPTLLEVKLKYRKEIRNREWITIDTRAELTKNMLFTIFQTMKNEQGETCCEAEFLAGLFDMKHRRLILLTPEWLKAIGHGK